MRLREILGLLLVLVVATGTVAAQTNDASLVRAVKNQDMATARQLIAEGADVGAQDSETMTALHWAAHWGDFDMVQLLLSEGAEANRANRYGVTPLHEASLIGHVAMVEALVRAGADPNAAFGSGETPVMTAARTGNVDTIRVLVGNGGQVNAAEEWRGQTPLMWAANEGHADMIRYLISEGANIDQRSTLFEWDAAKSGNGGVTQNRPTGGLNALFFAARSGADEAGKVLIEAGAELNFEEPQYGFSALETSIINGHWDFAAMLIEAGAEIDNGALYAAIEARNTPPYTNRPPPPKQDKIYNSLDIVKMLLERGANPSRVQDQDEMPERQAQGAIRVPAGAAPIHSAMAASDMATLQLLLAYGANASAQLNDGTTPLMVAAGKRAGGRYERGMGPRDDRRIELMKLLLANGARIDSTTGRTRESAVHFAAQAGNPRFVEYLAAMGADLSAPNSEGATPRDMMAARTARLNP